MLALPSTLTRVPRQIPRWLAVLWLALWSPLLVRSQEAHLTESDLKAAFLYNFAKFVDWPKDAFATDEAPIDIGIYGDDDFISTLRALLENKQAHGRPFAVRKVSSLQEAKICHLLFFRGNDSRRLGQIIDSIRRLPILTVGESADFLDSGGMLNLFFEDKQLRFDVNPGPAEAAKLNISSQLMRLAKHVRKGGGK